MSRRGLSPARLEAFSDGVVAVIITILVLELRVPEPNGLAGLRTVLPAVFLYLLTFVHIRIYWVNHHYLVDEVETVRSSPELKVTKARHTSIPLSNQRIRSDAHMIALKIQ